MQARQEHPAGQDLGSKVVTLGAEPVEPNPSQNYPEPAILLNTVSCPPVDCRNE